MGVVSARMPCLSANGRDMSPRPRVIRRVERSAVGLTHGLRGRLETGGTTGRGRGHSGMFRSCIPMVVRRTTGLKRAKIPRCRRILTGIAGETLTRLLNRGIRRRRRRRRLSTVVVRRISRVNRTISTRRDSLCSFRRSSIRSKFRS